MVAHANANTFFKDDAQFEYGVHFVLSWMGIFIIVASFPFATVAVLTFFIAMTCISVHLHYQDAIAEKEFDQWFANRKETRYSGKILLSCPSPLYELFVRKEYEKFLLTRN